MGTILPSQSNCLIEALGRWEENRSSSLLVCEGATVTFEEKVEHVVDGLADNEQSLVGRHYHYRANQFMAEREPFAASLQWCGGRKLIHVDLQELLRLDRRWYAREQIGHASASSLISEPGKRCQTLGEDESWLYNLLCMHGSTWPTDYYRLLLLLSVLLLAIRSVCSNFHRCMFISLTA
jgi:hypothetical protein